MEKQLRNNIVLIGLIYDENLGDNAIYNSTVSIIEPLINSKIELRAIDLYGRVKIDDSTLKNSVVLKLYQKIRYKIGCPENTEQTIVRKVLNECNRKIDSKTMAVIFVGGGLIKFNHQIISAPMISVIEYCDNHRIPVMLSGVGVEGYDNSKQCQDLKKALNRKCVKSITTRDDIELLNNCYIDRKEIHTALVADPALSISKYYDSNISRNKVIGFGIGRKGLFTDYGGLNTDAQIESFWQELYNKFVENGYSVELFTNGFPADQEFANRISQITGAKLLDRPCNLKQLIDVITSFEGVIVTRLHSSIISFSYSIPCIGLVWNNKQSMFGKNINRPAAFVSSKELNADDVFEKYIFEKENDFSVSSEYLYSTQVELKLFLESIRGTYGT